MSDTFEAHIMFPDAAFPPMVFKSPNIPKIGDILLLDIEKKGLYFVVIENIWCLNDHGEPLLNLLVKPTLEPPNNLL